MSSHPLKSCVKLQHSIYQESDTPYCSQGPCSYFCSPLESAHNGKVLFHVRAGLAAVSVCHQVPFSLSGNSQEPASWCRGEGSINSLIHSHCFGREPMANRMALGKQRLLSSLATPFPTLLRHPGLALREDSCPGW